METHQKSVEWGLSVLFIIALTYGASVEAFRSFDPHHPTFPASDAESYIRLAQGNHNVFITHRYRVIIPYLAGRLGEILPSSSGLFSGPQIDSELRLKRSFYVVNLAFTIFTACLLLAFLRAVGFDAAWAHVGVAIFLCSSVTSYSTACCLVDWVLPGNHHDIAAHNTRTHLAAYLACSTSGRAQGTDSPVFADPLCAHPQEGAVLSAISLWRYRPVRLTTGLDYAVGTSGRSERCGRPNERGGRFLASGEHQS